MNAITRLLETLERVACKPVASKGKPPAQWCIMATKYTLFIAHILAERLLARGMTVDIVTEAPETFPHSWYIVVCPQMFDRLPPKEKRIAYQLEQSVTSRWFNDAYINTLKESFAILEYSRVNIDFMIQKGIAPSQIYYLPIGTSYDYKKRVKLPRKKYDLLFYGSVDSPHRQRMLAALKKSFRVTIVRKVFGDDIIKKIASARLVINLHYYDNALLEMPRIQECLSLGVPVVSESAQDMAEYPELSGAVWFFEAGSVPEMIKAVESAMKKPISSKTIAQSVALSTQRFAVAFDRFLDEAVKH